MWLGGCLPRRRGVAIGGAREPLNEAGDCGFSCSNGGED